MTTNLKKKILLTTELGSSAVGVFFQEAGFELEYSYIEGCLYQFVIDDACPEVKSVPRLQMTMNLDESSFPTICGRINKEMFESEEGRLLLLSYFHDAIEFDLVDRYSKEMANIYSIKIHEYLNLGYFIDLIVIEAYKAKFDISSLRAYLNAALTFSFSKVESSLTTMPIDVSYSHNGEAFTVQISLLCDEWKGLSEVNNLINELTFNTNYFDVTYFNKTNRLKLSSLIFKNPALKSAKASFVTEVYKRSSEDEIKKNVPRDIYSGLIFNEQVRYEAPAQDSTNSATKLFIARKFAHFIKDYRLKIEDPPVALGKLIIDDVTSYLIHYPKQEELEEIDFEVKNLIFKLLVNKVFSDDVDDFIKVIMDSSPYGVVREIQKIIGDKSLDEIEFVVASYNAKSVDDFVKQIKGRGEGEVGRDIFRVSGSSSDTMSDNDLWEIRKSQLNIKEDDKNHFSQLNNNEADDSKMEGLINHNLIVQSSVDRENLEKEFAQKLLGHTNLSDAVKLESQMDRIKKIMYQLKKEIVKLQDEKKEREAIDRKREDVNNENTQSLKSNLDLSFELIKNKDQRIEVLEQKINLMRNDQSHLEDASSNAVIKKLEGENKSLSFKLELANKKYAVATEKMIQREVTMNNRHKIQIDRLSEKLKLTQSILEEIKIEKSKLEIHQDEFLRKSGHNTEGNNIKDEKDEMIQSLSLEKKGLEEKFRSQTLELKKVEQKLKFTTSQLESSIKKKSGASLNLKSAEAYTKQLEQVSARMAEATAEVVDKRREIVKVKQENAMMLMKINELEKKLSNLDKKVA